MQRAFSFPVTLERSRTKERLEASLAGLCELELRKQRQEGLVLGALALGDHLETTAAGDVSLFSCWGQDNLTLRRQLSALQTSPWGLVQTIEQQMGELRINTDHYDAAQGDTVFYESSEGQSPKGRTCSAETTEMVSSWPYTNDRPKSVGDTLLLNGESDMATPQSGLLRSFSAPHPPLEGIAEEATPMELWMQESSQVEQPSEQQQLLGDQVTQEDYRQATRVEGYILHLVQRHTLLPRPCQPRTTLSPDPSYSFTPAHASLNRKSPSLSTEQGHAGPQIELSSHPKNPSWGCDLPEGEACGGEAPSLEEERYLMLPYPQCRPHSMTGRLPSPLPFLDPNCGGGALNLCCEPSPPQHCPQPPINQKHNLVSAQYIPGQVCHAPLRSPKHFNPAQSKTHQSSPDHHNAKPRNSRKSHNDKQRAKKSSGKAGRSQSENSLLGQRVLPERRYSTTERHQGRGDQAQGQVVKVHVGNNSDKANRRWCSNLELSQDEGENNHMEQGHRRPPRKARPAHSGHHHHHQQQQQNPHNHHPQQHSQRWHSDFQQRAPLCQGEDPYAGAAPAESSSSMSEVYSPASSSLSSDSDESGGLVWPQQLPPRLVTTSSSSSPTAQAASANPPAQPKAFVKIKASHALKKKILRFRSGSLKVMTTV